VFRTIRENSTLLAELLTGNVDLYVSLAPEQVQQVLESPALEFLSFPYRSVFFVAWNGRVPKLSDARVRKALTVGTNRRQILEGLRGGRGVLINTGVPPTHWAFEPALSDSFPHDPDRARSLLSEAGWDDRDGNGVRENAQGEPLEIEVIYNTNLERQEIAEIMQAQLREVGVDLQPREMDDGAWVRTITAPEREFEGTVVSFETEFRLDERGLFHSDGIDGAYAFSGTSNPTLDRYLDTLQLITDREEALPYWHAYQEAFVQEHPYTFLFSAHRLEGVNRRLRGAVFDPRGEWATIREWWIAPEDRRTR
jgi:peptide/nickel transport system substrate-binding protein